MARVALCAVLLSIACAGSRTAPEGAPRATSGKSAAPLPSAAPGPSYDFQPYARSPQAAPAPPLACRGDLALEVVASNLAERHLERDLPDASEIALALRAAGSPYVWPRVWALRGDGAEREAVPRAAAWLGAIEFEGDARCALRGARGGAAREAWVALAVDVLADLRPLPTSVELGSFVDFDAELLFDTPFAEVLLLGPSGPPRRVPVARDGHDLRARFRAERRGPWLLQVMADARGGPRPVAEALVFAGDAPDASYIATAAPGEEAAGALEAKQALFAMANRARRSEGARQLSPHPTLDRLATAHAESMQRAGRLAHDVGQGTPDRRVEESGLAPRAVGENIAHAMDARGAHRVLWWSPSHRKNLLTRSFDHLGVGFAVDPDGSLWVAQIFAELDGIAFDP